MKNTFTNHFFASFIHISMVVLLVGTPLLVPFVAVADNHENPAPAPTPAPPQGPCTILADRTRLYFPNSDDDKHLNIMDYGWYSRDNKRSAVLEVLTDNCVGQKVKITIKSGRTAKPINEYAVGPKEYEIGQGGVLSIIYTIGEEQCIIPTHDQMNDNTEKLKKILTQSKDRVVELAKQKVGTFNDSSRQQSYAYLDEINRYVKAAAQQNEDYSFFDNDTEEGISINPIDFILHGGKILDADQEFYTAINALPLVGQTILVVGYALQEKYLVIRPGDSIAQALAYALDTIAVEQEMRFYSDCAFYAIVESPNKEVVQTDKEPIQYQCYNEEEYGPLTINTEDVTCFDGEDEDKNPETNGYYWTIKNISDNLAGMGFDPGSPCLDEYGAPIQNCQELLAPIPGFGARIDDDLTIGKYVNIAFQMVMGFLGLAAVIKIIYGGILYMTSDSI